MRILVICEVVVPHVAHVALHHNIRVDIDDLVQRGVDVRQLEPRIVERVHQVQRPLPDLWCEHLRVRMSLSECRGHALAIQAQNC